MTRLVSGLVLAAATLALIWWLPPAALTGVVAVICVLAVTEYARITSGFGIHAPYWPMLAASVTAAIVVPFPWLAIESILGVMLLAIAVAVLASERPFAAQATDAALAMLAPIYIGVPLGSLVAIHAMAGREAVLLMIATVAISDTAQYYTGRAFGRTPLAPRISPKKTREGALGGFVVAPAFLAAAGSIWMPSVPTLWLVVLGVVIVAAGIAGDLFKSILKRAADLKDSGTIIPGHGGVLDRIDALLFVAPLFLLFLRVI